MKKKVFVGLSGGVDSAVSAALLKERGYEVVGVFIKTWHPDFLPCTWPSERRDAMRVAAHLDIPFETLDLGAEYERDVAREMIQEYAAGRTPNPDVLCNKVIKFGAFLLWARERGGVVATGHYARVIEERGEYHLYAGVDGEKDQSYFLWMLASEDLSSILFPVGEMKKSDVRKHAASFRLPNAQKKDSQGICFLGAVPLEDFLRRYIPLSPGPVLDEEGRTIGTHKGFQLYALGQRHGFFIHENNANTPYFVVGKDPNTNSITVSATPARNAFLSSRALLQKTEWIGSSEDGPCGVRLRYREALRSASFSRSSGGAELSLEQPTLIPLGQSAVLYRSNRVLGGGVLSNLSAEPHTQKGQ